MKKSLLLLWIFSFSASVAVAQENLTYQKPSASILALADYERAPNVSMDSRKEYMLFSYRNTYKTLDDLNQEEMRLGGLRINPVTNIASAVNYISNLKIRKISDKIETQISGLPQNPRITYITWSPNEKKIAFTNTVASGVELWVIDVVSASAKKLTDASLNGNLGNPFNWMMDTE